MYYYAAAIVSEFFDDTIAAVTIYSKHEIFYRTIGYPRKYSQVDG